MGKIRYIIVFIWLMIAGCYSPLKTQIKPTEPMPTAITGTPTPILTDITGTPTPILTDILVPTLTATTTPTPMFTATPVVWQSYRMTYSIRIGGVGKLWMPVPREWDGIGMTNVSHVEISPEPNDVYQDIQGNKIAFWDIRNRNTSTYSVSFLLDLTPVRYTIDPNKIEKYDQTSSEYQRYTRPSSRIESDQEEIIQLAKKIVGDETNPYNQAKLIYQWVSEKLARQGNDGETALSTLKAQTAACGGHSFLYIALLRSLGIPARDVGGIMAGDGGYFPDVSIWGKNLQTHIWAEFLLPGYGWVQTDPTFNKPEFLGYQELRVVLFHGEDIELKHEYPLLTVPWFHMPQADRVGNSDPKTQVIGEELRLKAEKLP